MAKVFYLVNRKTGARYRVIGRDREKGTITLKGDIAQFEEAFDPAKFKSMGYDMKTEEEDDEDAEQ